MYLFLLLRGEHELEVVSNGMYSFLNLPNTHPLTA
jgi:hypothetical protein